MHSIKRIKGKHSFTSKESNNFLTKDASYKICVFINGSSIFNRMVVKMRLRFDSDGTDDRDLSATLQNSDTNFSTRHLKRIIDKVRINFKF